MANPSVTSEPKKTINSFESRWNASSLPIVFTINNDKYPTGETVTNYRTEIDIYVDGALIGQIEQIPDSNNNTVVDVRKYVQTGLTLKPIGTVNDTNAWCEFYIIAREKYTDIYGNDKEHGADGDSEIFYSTLSALQFGNSRGGNMYDYVVDQDKTDTASFMTFFERGQLLDTTTYYLNIILNESPVDLDVNQYDINGNLLQNDLLDIDDEGIGLYRITLDDITFLDDTTYFTAQIFSNLYGESLSELFTIDIDLECADTLAAPSGLTMTSVSKTSNQIDWTSNSTTETGFGIERSTTSGSGFTQIDTVGAGVTTYTDSSVSDLGPYYYRVRALGTPVNSNYTSEVSIFNKAESVSGATMTDVDAAFFVIEANITDSNQAGYVDTLVLNLKTGTVNGTNTWNVFDIAIYPYIGGTASTHAVNLRNPGTFDLTFVNSPTHSSTGVDYTTGTQYARTGIISSTDMTTDNFSFSVYFRDGTAANSASIGARDSPDFHELIPRSASAVSLLRCYNDTAGAGRCDTGAFPSTRSLVTHTKRSISDYEVYRKGASVDSQTVTGGGSPVAYELYLMATNNAGSAQSNFTNEERFRGIGKGITDSQAADWFAAVQAFQTSLGREEV